MNNFSVLPFYSSVAEQNHRLPYAYGAVYPLYCDDTRILPFQIIRPTRQNTITSVILFDKDGTQVRILTSDMSFDIVALEDYDVIVYTAQFGYAQELPIGQYYISVSDGAQTWYSDIFTIVSDITPYVKLEWYDEDNFVMDAGTIVYNNPRFINRLYLNTEIGKPDYQFEEEGEQRDGYFFPEKQLSEKTYRFTILAPEYLCDVMRFIRMADHIQITADGYTYNADTFLITPKWQTQGDLASVEVEFESNTVAKKLGDARVRRTIGDFNDDYNDDYDGSDTPVPPVPPTPTEAPENDVNFYDYDGFRVASYTIAEAKALTALPTPPTHQGLTFQEWNWSLSDITSYNRQYIDIGANYAPTDGKTHFKVNVSAGYDIMLPIYGRAMTITVDWGDGNSDDYTYGAGSNTTNNFAHTYASAGEYDIKVTCERTGSYEWGISWSGAIGQQAIYEINCGTYFSLNINYGLGFLSCQISITKDTTCSLIRGLWCSSIPQINIPNVTPSLSGYYCFQFHNGRISLPKKVSNATSALAQNATYEKLVMADFDESVTFSSGAFSSMRWVKILSIPDKQFATLSSGQFFQNNNMLKELDVVQGWTPTQSIIFSASTNWTAETMVKLFGKLGTTTGSITLTFGSTNLNKLTAEEKAIATNKGYTLA